MTKHEEDLVFGRKGKAIRWCTWILLTLFLTYASLMAWTLLTR